MQRGVWVDQRGVAEGIGFLLAISVLTVFLIMSFQVFSTVFTGSAGAAQSSQLETEATQLAATLERVDRDVRATTADSRVGERLDLSTDVAGDQYTIELTEVDPNNWQITFETVGGEVSATAVAYVETDLVNSVNRGGSITVVREDGASQITIQEAS